MEISLSFKVHSNCMCISIYIDIETRMKVVGIPRKPEYSLHAIFDICILVRWGLISMLRDSRLVR